MTVSSSNARVEYAGDDVTDDFTGTFRILDESHIKVILVDTSDVGTEQTLTTDYTVAGVGNSTFTVTMIVPPATGEVLIIQRDMPFMQETDYVDADPFPAQAHEDALDERVMEAQELLLLVDRSFRLADEVPAGFDIELPIPVSTYFLRVNDAADGVEWYDIGDATLSIPADLSVTTAKLAAESVTVAKMSASATDVLFGRSTAGAGAGEEIPCTAAGRALLDDANATAQRTTLGAAASGAATGSGITMATARMLGRTTASTGAIEEISVGAGLSLSGGELTVASGMVVQSVIAESASEFDIGIAPSGYITPCNNSIPQNTDGLEIITVTITPKSASNTLRVYVEVPLHFYTTGGGKGVLHVHRDSTANAVGAAALLFDIGGGDQVITEVKTLSLDVTAGSTSATTFKLRAGLDAYGPEMKINKAAYNLGGLSKVRIKIEEIKA